MKRNWEEVREGASVAPPASGVSPEDYYIDLFHRLGLEGNGFYSFVRGKFEIALFSDYILTQGQSSALRAEGFKYCPDEHITTYQITWTI